MKCNFLKRFLSKKKSDTTLTILEYELIDIYKYGSTICESNNYRRLSTSNFKKHLYLLYEMNFQPISLKDYFSLNEEGKLAPGNYYTLLFKGNYFNNSSVFDFVYQLCLPSIIASYGSVQGTPNRLINSLPTIDRVRLYENYKEDNPIFSYGDLPANDEDLLNEEDLRILLDSIQKQSDIFCYNHDTNMTIADLIHKSGYNFGITLEQGYIEDLNCDKLRLPTIQATRYPSATGENSLQEVLETIQARKLILT